MIDWYFEITRASLVAFVGFLFYKVRKVQDKLDNTVSEERVRQLIEDKIKVIYERQQDFKEDLIRLEDKIDYILDLLMKK